jgi:hypothetical protein
MSKVLLQLADQDFVVSSETAAKVEKSLPADRFVTITRVEEPAMQLGQNKSNSVFDRHQPKLTDKEKEHAARFAKHLAKPKRKEKTS